MAKTKTLEALLHQREEIDRQLKAYDTNIVQLEAQKETLVLKIERLKHHITASGKGIENARKKREALQQKRDEVSEQICNYKED